MNKKTILIGITTGLLFVNGMFANDPKTEKEKFDINSIVYIEDEMEFDLGFDTADYLPEGFDPYQIYFDLDRVEYLEEDFTLDLKTRKYLPEGFNVYAPPSDAQSINFIDESDFFEVGIDTRKYLPLDFNAFRE